MLFLFWPTSEIPEERGGQIDPLGIFVKNSTTSEIISQNQKYTFLLYNSMVQKAVQNFANFLKNLSKFYFLMSWVLKQSTICENQWPEVG